MKSKFILCVIFILSGISPLFSFQMNYYGERQRVRAPELNGGVGWLNTDKPLSLAGLKGKVVLLDFWTYGCINCIHIIPKIKELEAQYADQLVVIGVHSAKFENEKDTANIRKIILRYGVEHPVINDANFKIWDNYAIRAWPGLVLIDPDGYIIGRWFGEGQFGTIENQIRQAITEFRKKGSLDEKPLNFALEKAKVGDLPLAFPGKVLADEKNARLYISDSNHNRIVVTDLNGKTIETIGSGAAGAKDGGYATASFNRLQGLALDGDKLYVADTENNLLRRVDLKNKKVETVGGTGKLEDFTGAGGKADQTAINSPWDLTLIGAKLYIAMAGSHQIWRLNLETDLLEPYAGTTQEARIDGKINEAGFAQPSGIVSDGVNLFVADSESNIIRRIDTQKGTVETLVGGDLFDFGDVDGAGDDVRLQHPLGIVLYDGKVLIADTYNHKIKTLDPKTKTVKTFAGSGKSGQKDGSAPTFYEPGGLSVAGGKLYVADTNNHAIRVVDLKTKTTSTLKIENLKPPIEAKVESGAVSPNEKENVIETRKASANSDASLVFNINLPDGFHLNPNAPQRYEIALEGGNNIEIGGESRGKFNRLPVIIPFHAGKPGSAAVKAKLTIFYCREDNTGTCQIKTIAWKIPISVVDDGKLSAKIEISAKVD